jgi:LuxR family transcriptional regulator, quorum-sensing system regulator BjaR1
LPVLDKTRFATDQSFRHMVIKNRCSPPKEELSNGEKEVLYWAGHGKTSEESGMLMKLTKSTVETYRKHAIAKLAASNITHAVYLAKLYMLIP